MKIEGSNPSRVATNFTSPRQQPLELRVYVHYPTDSPLLGDGIRVLTRSLHLIAEECTAGAVPVVNHARAVKRRLLEISRAAKSLAEASRHRLKDGYAGLLKLTRGVVRRRA